MRRRWCRILPRGLTHFHHYDRAGNRVRSELACGMGVAKRLLTTTLDSQHRPVILHDDNQTPGVTTDDRLTRWLYDPAGRTVRVTLPNGQIQVNHHDDAGRLVLRALHRQPAAGQTISNATLLASFTWNHDAAGNVKSQTENWYASGSQPARSRATAMAYDASNRLVEERIHDSGGTDPVVTTYTYDAANNRTGKIVALGSGSAPSGVETGHWSYTYNTANQLTRWVKRAAPGTGTVLAAASYSYDKNGNRLSKVMDGTTSLAVRTTTYTWDSWNRLAEVTVPVTATSKKSYEYTYDYRMRRKSLRQSGGGLKTHHTAVVFNGGLSVAEFRRSSNAALSPTDLPWARYLRGPDMGGGVGGLLGTLRHPVNSYERPVSPTASNPVTERVNLSNGRGDIVAQSDPAGTLTWTASYEAYGKRTLELGSNEDRQRANTKEEDPTGLLNEGFRYRDLETGVWLSRDPAGFVDGPNLYAYVKQNPWTSFDAEGLFEVSPHQPIHELITIKAYATVIGAADQKALNAAKAGIPSVKTATGSLASGVKRPDLGKVTGRSYASLLLGPLGPVVERADQLRSLHYGDQQWRHSMSSSEKTAGELRAKIVKGLGDQFSSARKQFEAGNEATAWAMIGEVLHTVQDSYSQSHTKRDPKTGEILSYNSYPAQDGKRHAEADSVAGGSFRSGLRGINIDDYSGVENKAGVRDATNASVNIINAFMNSDADAFSKQINETYRTSPTAEVGKSGGYGKKDPK